MLFQERAEPLVHDVVVGGRDRDSLRADGLEAVDHAVAHRRRAQARRLRHSLAELLVERLALVERERRARELDRVGALGRELLGRGRDPRDHAVEAVRRHLLDAQARHDELQALAVHRNALLRHAAIQGREDQAEHGYLAGRGGAAGAEPRDRCGRGAGREKFTAFRHIASPSCGRSVAEPTRIVRADLRARPRRSRATVREISRPRSVARCARAPSAESESQDAPSSGAPGGSCLRAT